jgi:hypothetical protein
MKNFTLVNPVIKGSLNTTIKAESSDQAAMKAYKNISAYFSKNVPKFNFTMKEGNKFHHFTAKEKINKEGKIRFCIDKNTKVNNEAHIEKFIDEVDTLSGGGKYSYQDDSSSDDSSSESPDYKYYKPIRRSKPIDYWYYYPNAYTQNYYYVPQFVPTVSPYMYVMTYNIP